MHLFTLQFDIALKTSNDHHCEVKFNHSLIKSSKSSKKIESRTNKVPQII